MKTIVFLLSTITIFWGAAAGAQGCTELPSSSSGSGVLAELLGDNAQRIAQACLLSAGEESLSARIEHSGFDDKDYRIVGQLLGPDRRPIPGCDPYAVELESNGESTDLNFQFKPGESQTSTPYLPVRYLKVTISEADDLLADFDLGGLTITGTSAEYLLDHQFRVGAGPGGTSNVTVSVGFTPVKRAATIKQ